MSIEHATRTLATLIAESNSGQVLLPNFQRSYVWRPDDHKSLAASILLGIPCGSLLLVRGENTDFATRKVGIIHSEPAGTVFNCDFLLDGQQRASTIRSIFSDTFRGEDWRKPWGETFNALKNRWSISIVPKQDDPDLFGYHTLHFSGLPPEPDLVADALVQHSIYKTKGLDAWFHPAFQPRLGKKERYLAVGVGAAADGVAPLWEVTESGSADDGPIKVALQRIADGRREELFAAYKDGTLDQEEFSDLLRAGETWLDLTEDKVRDRLGDRRAEWIQKVLKVITDPNDFRLGTIELTQDELPKAIAIFEAINRGGSPLTPFDLVTARYARGQSATSLPEMIQASIEKYDDTVPEALYGTPGRKWAASNRVALVDDALTTAFKTQFLQVLVMLRRLSADPEAEFSVDDIKAEKVLALSAEDIDAGWEAATMAVLAAWRYLQLRCGVKDEGALRNKLLVLPLAMALRDPDIPVSTYNKVEYWYWTSVLSNTYTARQNENSVTDTNLLLAWIKDGERNPFASREERVLNDDGYSSKDTLLRTSEDERVGTDVGLYLLQLTLALGGQDIALKQKLDADIDDLQDHHLIPLGSATTVGQATKAIRKGKGDIAALLNSPLNRVYQSGATNQAIGAKSIAQYMKDLPGSVKSSLFLSVDDDKFLQAPEHEFDDFVRSILGARYESLRSAIVNRLSVLKQ
ncbi:hypothetical protein AU196_22480 [Mycobacterium sp. IS-1742]|uniref:DUF262 domain-containing protein n=1 Tax=Mycobacterium sp. IS-1742 TaxID=1772285 RepID=UPI0007400089|nr:DUF262 domain-containing protein [Mycobacterium sp. IS-1742]KUI25581.1 hypothetical protein AU196_22480 [Mycobacterium sp. IS-1742]